MKRRRRISMAGHKKHSLLSPSQQWLYCPFVLILLVVIYSISFALSYLVLFCIPSSFRDHRWITSQISELSEERLIDEVEGEDDIWKSNNEKVLSQL